MVSLSPCLGAYLSVVGKCGLLSAGHGVGSCFWERGQERCHWKDLFWERESLLLWGDVLRWCFREGGLPMVSFLLENNPVSYHCGCFTFPIPLVEFQRLLLCTQSSLRGRAQVPPPDGLPGPVLGPSLLAFWVLSARCSLIPWSVQD